MPFARYKYLNKLTVLYTLKLTIDNTYKQYYN